MKTTGAFKPNLKKNKKKIILILISVVVILAMGIVGLFFFWKKSKVTDGKGRKSGFSMSFGRESGSTSMLSGLNLQELVTAQGVTNMGTVSETFDVTELETELKIERVYVASGDELKAGDKVLKLTEDSVEAARKELTEKERDAELSYRAGAIEYEQNKIVAEYDRDSAKLSGTQAESVYQDSMLDVKNDVDSAQEKLSDTKEQIQEYASYVDGNNYKSYFKVDEYQELYDENLKILSDRMEEYGISWTQVVGGGGSGFGGGSMGGGDTSSEYGQWVSILKNLYSILEDNKKDLDNAQSEYDNALSTASLEKRLLELSLPELEEKLAQAKAAYEKSVLQNQLTKEKSVANADRADHDYETTMEKVESDFQALESAWDDAKKNLETFEQQIGDGYFYASADGNVLRSSVRAGNALRANSTVFTYSDPSAMTVTVSVDQSNVASIVPGESAVVMSQAGATMEGTVKAVNPVSTSESRNNVTYSVTVELDGAGELKSNESVTVIFGITLNDITASNQDGTSSEEGDGKKGMPEGWSGERPEGMPEGWSGESQEGMPEGWSGERPEGMPEGWSGERPEGRSGKGKGDRSGRSSDENSGKGAGE